MYFTLIWQSAYTNYFTAWESVSTNTEEMQVYTTHTTLTVESDRFEQEKRNYFPPLPLPPLHLSDRLTNKQADMRKKMKGGWRALFCEKSLIVTQVGSDLIDNIRRQADMSRVYTHIDARIKENLL